MKFFFFILCYGRVLIAAQAPIPFDSEYPFLFKVLRIITEEDDFKSKKNLNDEQYIRYQICCSLHAKRSTIMPSIGAAKLKGLQDFVESQTPPKPSAAQLSLMPLKYLNAFGHVLDNLRPHLEKQDAQIAQQYAQLEDNSKYRIEFVTLKKDTTPKEAYESALSNPQYAIPPKMYPSKKEKESGQKKDSPQLANKQQACTPRPVKKARASIHDPTLFDRWTTTLADAINGFTHK